MRPQASQLQTAHPAAVPGLSRGVFSRLHNGAVEAGRTAHPGSLIDGLHGALVFDRLHDGAAPAGSLAHPRGLIGWCGAR